MYDLGLHGDYYTDPFSRILPTRGQAFASVLPRRVLRKKKHVLPSCSEAW